MRGNWVFGLLAGYSTTFTYMTKCAVCCSRLRLINYNMVGPLRALQAEQRNNRHLTTPGTESPKVGDVKVYII